MTKKFFLTIVLVAWMCSTTLPALACEPFITFHTPAKDALPLAGANILVDTHEHPCVLRAAESLRHDLLTVTGSEPTPQGLTVVVGTVGSNKQIDQWVRHGLLTDLKGRSEKYIIKTINQQLVIAGSDKRGTAFGVYELCQQIGVSPWYYWADVPIDHHDQLFVRPGEYTDGEPHVRYRGLFLNDEAPCLTSWVKHTFGTDYGDHCFYERVFDLILRLKGNFLWPAMWSWAFYADDPENSRLADEMGIIIGTSHHEPMGRNHQEYARHRSEWGPWNYQNNQQRLDQFFREGIERMRGTDDIVTIGMRGDGDEAMSEEADTRLLQRIVENQRRIIKEVTGRPAKETPQVWALYKEVLDYYDRGMRVPDDVLILLCDDNWGNLRRVPTAKERQHPGGWGLYYHVDYVGAPRNSKWLNVTPSQNMWEQLTLAAQNGLDRMWILNVGDLKPMEYPITLFMDMAWRPSAVTVDVVGSHTLPFCRQLLGDNLAADAARLLDRACQMNGRSTAEMLDAHTYNLESGEWRRVADDYMRLEASALRLLQQVPARRVDSYCELILFPIQAMSNLHQMYYAQAMNQHLAAQNDPDANQWADDVSRCFHRDSLLCAQYNNELAGGKWQGMMTQKHIGYTSWNDDFSHDVLPPTTRVETGQGGWTFQSRDGYVAIEAEHYHTATAPDGTSWTVIPRLSRTRSGLSLMPYTQPVNGASLTYRFTLDPQTSARPNEILSSERALTIHVIVKSTLDYLNKEGLTYTVSLDGQPAQTVNFNSRLNEEKQNIYTVFYPTVARRVVESTLTFHLPPSTPDLKPQTYHTLTLQPNDPAIVFEKVVIDCGGYIPQFLFGEESPHSRQNDIY